MLQLPEIDALLADEPAVEKDFSAEGGFYIITFAVKVGQIDIE